MYGCAARLVGHRRIRGEGYGNVPTVSGSGAGDHEAIFQIGADDFAYHGYFVTQESRTLVRSQPQISIGVGAAAETELRAVEE